MPRAILITQCLQNDFVQPLGRYDPLPNTLHVGYDEALRLMGPDPEHGPVAAVMRWATAQPEEELELINIRDWHDPDDPDQASHLALFGRHCIQASEGAAMVFEGWGKADRKAGIVNATTLNDFEGTNLAELLDPFAGQSLNLGLIGVWTEAKITFLAYELATRYPQLELGVCTALTASSSRANHFLAIDQLQRLLDVQIFASVGSFIRFLGGGGEELALPSISERYPSTSFSTDIELSATDNDLLRYLFRECRTAHFRVLDGGFSGNVVLGSESVSLEGIDQVPHVVKIGPQDAIGQERARFERIESVLGNAAPSITAFADLGERGAIKYRYASMRGGFSTTFQKMYEQGLPTERTGEILDTVFVELLGRFYDAATLESIDLLEHYGFSSRWAASVRRKVEQIAGDASGETLDIAGLRQCSNLCRFYEEHLDALPRSSKDSTYVSYVHGDLNGANIIVDSQDNVWIIDFFHTDRAHVLRDLIKLENDVLYIFTKIRDDDGLKDALTLTDRLMLVQDLAKPLPPIEETGLHHPEVVRAYHTVRALRAYYPALIDSDRSPLQLYVALLRYAAHTLGFDESNPRQKQWALYTASRCADRIVDMMRARGPLRVDWLDAAHTGPGKLGITLLPGRKDYGRDLTADLQSLTAAGVKHIVTLVPDAELDTYGVGGLAHVIEHHGLGHRVLPMLDQRVCTVEEMRGLVAWINERLAADENVVLHCVGGLGRSGTVAACYLKARGLSSDEAIAEVRRVRSPRAVESETQEAFVGAY